MKLYHGTSSRYLPSIKENGLKPRKKSKGNWTGTITSNPNAVYLTNAYPLHFAGAACRGQDSILILEVDTTELNPFLFAPDEDFLEQASRSLDIKGLKDTDMASRTKWFRKRALTQFQHEWQKSIDHLGTCCYYGTIPFESVTRYAVLARKSPPKFMSDPTITLINYKIMGGFYRNLIRRIFDDPLDQTDQEGFEFMHMQLSNVPRTGIEVIEVQK